MRKAMFYSYAENSVRDMYVRIKTTYIVFVL